MEKPRYGVRAEHHKTITFIKCDAHRWRVKDDGKSQECSECGSEIHWGEKMFKPRDESHE